jgi:hypothetical protein
MALGHVLRYQGPWLTGGRGSELFRAEHGGDQIEEEEHRDESDDEVFHKKGG